MALNSRFSWRSSTLEVKFSMHLSGHGDSCLQHCPGGSTSFIFWFDMVWSTSSSDFTAYVLVDWLYLVPLTHSLWMSIPNAWLRWNWHTWCGCPLSAGYEGPSCPANLSFAPPVAIVENVAAKRWTSWKRSQSKIRTIDFFDVVAAQVQGLGDWPAENAKTGHEAWVEGNAAFNQSLASSWLWAWKKHGKNTPKSPNPNSIDHMPCTPPLCSARRPGCWCKLPNPQSSQSLQGRWIRSLFGKNHFADLIVIYHH